MRVAHRRSSVRFATPIVRWVNGRRSEAKRRRANVRLPRRCIGVRLIAYAYRSEAYDHEAYDHEPYLRYQAAVAYNPGMAQAKHIEVGIESLAYSVKGGACYGYSQDVPAGGYRCYARNLREGRSCVPSQDVPASCEREGFHLGTVAVARFRDSGVLQEAQSGSVRKSGEVAREAHREAHGDRTGNLAVAASDAGGEYAPRPLRPVRYGDAVAVSPMDIVDATVSLLVATVGGVDRFAVEVIVDGTLVSWEEYDSHEDALDSAAVWRMVFEATLPGALDG